MIKAVKEEFDKINEMLVKFGVSAERINILQPIIENTAWMKSKLDKTRKLIKKSDVAIAYDNGGGQRGIRENPLFKGYESLWKSYISGMDKILAALPDEVADKKKEEIEKPKTTLELIRSKRAGA